MLPVHIFFVVTERVCVCVCASTFCQSRVYTHAYTHTGHTFCGLLLQPVFPHMRLFAPAASPELHHLDAWRAQPLRQQELRGLSGRHLPGATPST